MSEIITDLETTVASTDGHEYYVQVAGEPLASGTWEAWLEFVPFDDDLEVLLTQTETTQPTRDDVVSWSATLTGTYLQGAFARALGNTARFVVRDFATDVTEIPAPFDPFDVLPLGKAELRARLRVLSRPELLGMISSYNLNPAEKSLIRLTDSQLVTFIVTAVEVQAVQGRQR
jgi:hypothetical protein